MIRATIILLAIAIGGVFAIQSPFYMLLMYLWNAYFRPDDWAANAFIASLNLSFILGGLTVVVAALGGQLRRISLPIVLVLVFLLEALVSTSVSLNPERSWTYWQELAKALTVTYLIASLVTDVSRIRIAFLVIGLSLGFEAARQGWYGFILHPATPNFNTHPALGDNNGVAQGMMMLVPLLWALAATASSQLHRYGYLFLLAGAFLRGLTTYSRGGFLAACAICLIALMRSKHRLRGAIALLVASGFLLAVMPASFWDRMSTITLSAEEQDDSVRGRVHFWNTAIDMAADYPLTGIGLNAFQAVYDRYDTSEGRYGSERAVHSTWFGTLAELGVPGLLVFLAILLWAFRACRLVRRGAVTVPELSVLLPYAVALEAGLVAYVVSATFLNSQYSEMYWHFIGLTLALRSVHDKILRDTTDAAQPRATTITLPHEAAALRR